MELKINFSNLKLNFKIISSTQVTWHNLDRPIDCDQ